MLFAEWLTLPQTIPFYDEGCHSEPEIIILSQQKISEGYEL